MDADKHLLNDGRPETCCFGRIAELLLEAAGETRCHPRGVPGLYRWPKCYGLISRFSEDIDVTVFREDLHEPATVEALETLIGKIMRDGLAGAGLDPAAGRIECDDAAPDGQTLLLWYPNATTPAGSYVRPAVKIESGAKSALDPNRPVTIRPYAVGDVAGLDLEVAGITAVDAKRTFWDKVVVILHSTRRWFERRGRLRGEGQRVLATIMTFTASWLMRQGGQLLAI